MNKTGKIVGIICLVLLVLGAALIGIGIARGGSLDFSIDLKHKEVSKGPRVLVTGSFTPEAPQSVVIDADVTNVTLRAGDQWALEYALYFEPEITEENGVLTVLDPPKEDPSLWFDFGKSGSAEPRIIVTVPEAVALQLQLDVGDVRIEGVTLRDAAIGVDVGDVTLRNVTAATLHVTTDTGDIELERVRADSITAEADVGEIELLLPGTESDYAIDAKTDVGEVEVSDRACGTDYLSDGAIPVTLRTDTGDLEIDFGA